MQIRLKEGSYEQDEEVLYFTDIDGNTALIRAAENNQNAMSTILEPLTTNRSPNYAGEL